MGYTARLARTCSVPTSAPPQDKSHVRRGGEGPLSSLSTDGRGRQGPRSAGARGRELEREGTGYTREEGRGGVGKGRLQLLLHTRPIRQESEHCALAGLLLPRHAAGGGLPTATSPSPPTITRGCHPSPQPTLCFHA